LLNDGVEAAPTTRNVDSLAPAAVPG